MIDVGIGSVSTPDPSRWVGVEVARQVFMDEFLQVEAEAVASGADDNVCADAGGAVDVAAGVFETGVKGVVAGGDADLRAGGFGETFAGGAEGAGEGGVRECETGDGGDEGTSFHDSIASRRLGNVKENANRTVSFSLDFDVSRQTVSACHNEG